MAIRLSFLIEIFSVKLFFEVFYRDSHTDPFPYPEALTSFVI